MEPRGFLRGILTAMLMGIGIVAIGSIGPARVAAETVAQAGPVLVIDGKTSDGKAVTFDLAALKSMPVTKITTMTPWTDGENLYEGVRVRDLLERVGAEGTTLLADAVDEYTSRIPIEDVRDYDVIVAYTMNGKPLRADDKGPLWIIYPYSEYNALQKDLYFSRSVWQLNRLTVQ